MSLHFLFSSSWKYFRSSPPIWLFGLIIAVCGRSLSAEGTSFWLCIASIVFMIVLIIAQGGLIYSVILLEQDRPLTFRLAWSASLAALWQLLSTVIEFGFILIGLAIPFILLFALFDYDSVNPYFSYLVFAIAFIPAVILVGIINFALRAAIVQNSSGLLIQHQINNNLISHGWDVLKSEWRLAISVIVIFGLLQFFMSTLAETFAWDGLEFISDLLIVPFQSIIITLIYLDYLKMNAITKTNEVLNA